MMKFRTENHTLRRPKNSHLDQGTSFSDEYRRQGSAGCGAFNVGAFNVDLWILRTKSNSNNGMSQRRQGQSIGRVRLVRCVSDSRALFFGPATFLSVKNGYQEMRKR